MAFRSSASATGTGTGTITATPAGVTAHDYLGAWWLSDSNIAVLTPPAGWTQRASVVLSLDGETQFFADKDDASGSDAFGFADDSGNNKALITAAWSGRNNSAPRSATPVTTGNSASNTSPISATITGITAANGDDIGIGLGTDDAAAGQRWTYSTITNYTEQVDGVAQDWVSGAGLQTRDNVSAGATGNFAVTITRGAGAGNSGYSGIVVAIAAAASGFNAALMAATFPQWPITVISQPRVVASGMTPPDNVPK